MITSVGAPTKQHVSRIKLSVSDMVVAGAALHVFLCYSYIVFRNYGFGSPVNQFSSVGDVFSVGVGKVLPTYLFLAVGFFLAHLYSDESPYKLKGRRDFGLHPTLQNGIGNWPIKAMPYIAFLGIAVGVFVPHAVSSAFIAFAITIVAMKIVFKLIVENDIDLRLRVPAAMCIFAYAFLAVSAYAFGFQSRTAKPDFFVDYPVCKGDLTLLFSTGDNFVATTKKGTRVIVRDDCSRIATFPSERVLISIY